MISSTEHRQPLCEVFPDLAGPIYAHSIGCAQTGLVIPITREDFARLLGTPENLLRLPPRVANIDDDYVLCLYNATASRPDPARIYLSISYRVYRSLAPPYPHMFRQIIVWGDVTGTPYVMETPRGRGIDTL